MAAAAALLLVLVSLAAGAHAIVSGTYFDRVFVIVLENTNYASAIADPYLKSLTTSTNPQGRLLSNYHAVSHPSEPNYIAMIAGSTFGLTSDANVNYNSQQLTDLLEARGISWKAYQENYPGTTSCYTSTSASGGYVRKHNPFMSFTSISGNNARCTSHIVNANQLNTDIANNAVPQFAFYTPNLNNDGHDTSVTYASNWLKIFLTSKLSNPNFITNTLVFITFDENEGISGNQVYACQLGPVVHTSTADTTSYTHFSLLRTIEDNWGLTRLGSSSSAAVFSGLHK